MTLIAVDNLTFGWEGRAENVFEGVSFHVDTNWRIGLIGRNGRGKTTLLQLLARSGELPHGGTIVSPVGFRYFPYEIADASLSTLEIIDAVCPAYEFWELCCELNLLGVSQEALFRPFETLSPGERTKALLATLFLGGDDFALLDEPTSHLDNAGKQAVAEWLSTKKGFLLVSHDRALLDAVCNHTLSVGRQGIEVMSGNYSVWATEKQRRDRHNIAKNEQLAKEIRKMKVAARRTADWSGTLEKTKYGNGPVDRGHIGHKSAKLMKRAKAIEARRSEASERKQGLLSDLETIGTLKMAPLAHHAKTLVELQDVRIDYLPQRCFNLEVEQGERLALTGDNGTGKSSLLKLIAGLELPHSGVVKCASGLVLSYLPQDASDLSGSLRRFAEDAGADVPQFFTILSNLGVERSAFEADLARLSDGQRRKALLARSLCVPAHLYLWDEPLNYIDIQTREQIEDLLLEYTPTMIFVEHDAYFSDQIATRSLALDSTGDS
jgi:lincosamide and streptogramin A transport system ATP-binding/permease protein